MKPVLAAAILAAVLPVLPAAAQSPTATCPGCGVVTSVKRLTIDARATEAERKSPAGFVANIPLGGGQASAGSVTEVRREVKPPVVRYEIVVKLDDGRFQVVTQDEADNLRVGDKVRIDRGKVSVR